MYSIIANYENIEQIEKIIDPGDILFTKTGIFDEKEIYTILEEALRIHSVFLIIDVTVAEGIDLLKAVKNYIILRPKTRIILLAPDKKPGDKIISKFVKLGIYDIVAPDIPEDVEEKSDYLVPHIEKAINKPKGNYSDVARWDFDLDLNIDGEDKEKQVDKIIKDTKYITPKDYKKVIGVLGLKQKGKTTIIDLIATQLSEDRNKIAVLDLTKEQCFYRLKCWSNQDKGEKELKRLELLERGERKPYEVDKYYHVYTQGEVDISNYNVFKAIETLKNEYNIILVDVSEVRESFKYILSDIYFVHDLNVLDLKELKNLVKEVRGFGISPSKIKFIINKVLKVKVKPLDIIRGIATPLNEIEEDKEDNYIDINRNECFPIPFVLKLMERTLNANYKGDEVISIPNEMEKSLVKLATDMYPARTKKKRVLGNPISKKLNSLFNKQ